MLPLFNRIKAWWTTADRNQRVTILGGIGALILVFVGTVFFVTRPHYVTLLENLSDTDQGAAVAALDGLGIPSHHDRPGVIEVPQGTEQDARMKLASAGKLPKGANHLSFPDLKAMGVMASPKVEDETIRGILQGEIESTLEKLDGVGSAKVLITSPRKSVFAEDGQKPTASVTITEDGKGMLTAANGRAIANLVCASVDDMAPEGVVVTTNALKTLWDGHDADSSSSKADLDAKVSREWEAKTQQALDDMFGPHNTRVIARADVDTTRHTVDTHDTTPTDRPTATESKVESVLGGAKKMGGFAGTPTNMPNPKAPATPPADGAAPGKYDGKEKRAVFDASTKNEKIEGGTGALAGLALTVVANSNAISDTLGVQKIVDGVMGGLIQRDPVTQLPLPNQKFSATVTSMKFDDTMEKATKAAAEAAAGQQRTQQVFSFLPIVAILLVALLVARQVGKISKAVLPAPPEPESSLAEVSHEALGMGVGAEFEGAMGALPAPGAEGEESPLALERIQDRVDVPLETLKQMAAERPEMVATLIKSFMLGEKV